MTEDSHKAAPKEVLTEDGAADTSIPIRGCGEVGKARLRNAPAAASEPDRPKVYLRVLVADCTWDQAKGRSLYQLVLVRVS